MPYRSHIRMGDVYILPDKNGEQKHPFLVVSDDDENTVLTFPISSEYSDHTKIESLDKDGNSIFSFIDLSRFINFSRAFIDKAGLYVYHISMSDLNKYIEIHNKRIGGDYRKAIVTFNAQFDRDHIGLNNYHRTHKIELLKEVSVNVEATQETTVVEHIESPVEETSTSSKRKRLSDEEKNELLEKLKTASPDDYENLSVEYAVSLSTIARYARAIKEMEPKEKIISDEDMIKVREHFQGKFPEKPQDNMYIKTMDMSSKIAYVRSTYTLPESLTHFTAEEAIGFISAVTETTGYVVSMAMKIKNSDSVRKTLLTLKKMF